jgi:acyl carrier protein
MLFADDSIVLTENTTAADIDGWDSFNHLSVIVATETEFGIKLTAREMDKMTKVADLVEIILRHTGNTGQRNP